MSSLCRPQAGAQAAAGSPDLLHPVEQHPASKFQKS
jgi:hypothetical protein